MDFTCDTKAKHVTQVTDEHLLDHFINHAKSDTLGRISMLWLDYAAIQKNAGATECLELAKLHSIAVDFPKSGVPAVIPKTLKLARSTPRPHWRELKNGPTYDCDSIIGLLYDKVVVAMDRGGDFRYHDSVAGRHWNRQGQLLCYLNNNGRKKLMRHLEKAYKNEIPESAGLHPDDDSHDLDNHCIYFAEQQKIMYDNELVQLMNRYKIHAEGEILTGCIRKFHKWNKKRQHDLAEEVKRQCTSLRRTCRDNFFREVDRICDTNIFASLKDDDGEGYDEAIDAMEEAILHDGRQRRRNTEVRDDDAQQFCFSEKDIEQMSLVAKKMASSYYHVTYDPTFVNEAMEDEDNESRSDETNRNKEGYHILFSFPWIVADIIAKGIHDTNI
eukprot:CAMPEP_0172509536 /NCGR_PEP_ID=MMETSP1066-20121228/221105_1 /TAXON_ID=671091 /ORGANISM="Coscinodiscus wailesii, Strain CCMP2513" /LENGTH=385 /DNA_ID=CAMNT_0013288063 /DNA_START=69 /DNA_END=1226 /DNA_ORIENTATION=+